MSTRIALTAPYSEVCMHLRVAGTPVLVVPLDRGMAQLYTPDGDPISLVPEILGWQGDEMPTLDLQAGWVFAAAVAQRYAPSFTAEKRVA